MHYITIEQRESLQHALEARAAALRDSIAESLGGHGGLPDRREDTDDDAVIDEESSFDAAMLERRSLELRQVEDALRRLHTPAYGECSTCSGDIPYSRLQANPLASRCAHCQAESESKAGKGVPSTL